MSRPKLKSARLPRLASPRKINKAPLPALTSRTTDNPDDIIPLWRILAPKKSCNSDKDSSATEPTSDVNLPEKLLRWVAFDWHQVTDRDRKLSIPARVTVCDIADGFLKEHKNSQFTSSIFKKMFIKLIEKLGNLHDGVLHKAEVEDYNTLLFKSCDNPNDVLGSFHILRLLGHLSSNGYMVSEDQNEFKHFIDSLATYLQKHEKHFFRAIDYVPVDSNA